MEVEKEVEEVCGISVVPTAPPPPVLRNEMPYAQGKNLMKSAATLIGQGDCKSVKESALHVCQRFLACYKTEECGIAWFYHNNDVEDFLQDGPT